MFSFRGILVRRGLRWSLPDHGERFEYHLTEKGVELAVSLLALMHWGDRHLSDKPPAIARRSSDRSPVSVRIVAKDGSAVAPD
jgi:DNA-binding HxlR family transcriptional regulator